MTRCDSATLGACVRLIGRPNIRYYTGTTTNDRQQLLRQVVRMYGIVRMLELVQNGDRRVTYEEGVIGYSRELARCWTCRLI